MSRLAGQGNGRRIGQLRNSKRWEAALSGAKKIARPTQFQIFFGEHEPVVRLSQHLQPLQCVLAVSLCDQGTVAGMLAPADAPAKLVKLGETEPIGVLDQHYRRIRYVNAYFDHGCAHEDLMFTGSKGAHDFILLGARHTPMQ